jgi:DNA-directed RNA polymerase subunit RPC12/RpoP
MTEYHYTCGSCGDRSGEFLHGEEHEGKSDMVVCNHCGDDVTVELAPDGETRDQSRRLDRTDEEELGIHMFKQNEVNERTVWSKTLHHESDGGDDDLFATVWFASVRCVHEVSGYAVWYQRRLKSNGGESGVSNGDYLLGFYATDARDDAIEFAVLAAMKPAADHVDPIQALDLLAAKAQRIESKNGETF